MCIFLSPLGKRHKGAWKTESSTKARSKPDTVDRRVRTDCTFVYNYNIKQYCSTETVFIARH